MKRERKDPKPNQSPIYALVRWTWEGCQTLSTQPQVGIQASDPLEGGWGGGWTRGSPDLCASGPHPVATRVMGGREEGRRGSPHQ